MEDRAKWSAPLLSAAAGLFLACAAIEAPGPGKVAIPKPKPPEELPAECALEAYILTPACLEGDFDGDGLTNGYEAEQTQTSPTHPDTDGDGLGDGAEVELGTNPLERDTDGDGLADGEEVNGTYLGKGVKTDPLKWDSDGDGWNDKEELDGGWDPRNPASPPSDPGPRCLRSDGSGC